MAIVTDRTAPHRLEIATSATRAKMASLAAFVRSGWDYPDRRGLSC
jgi:hypothetical protein